MLGAYPHMAMSTVKIQPLDWDSGILGLRCGLIDAAGLGCVMPPVLTRRILALCRKRDFDFIVIKMPANFSTSANSIIQAGASLIDTELSFRYCDTAAYEDNPAPGKLKVRFCRKIKGSALLPLAGGMRFSRYFNDPHIPRYKALQLWKDSIRNHCRGLKDQLLVAYYNDTPCGIVTLEFQDILPLHLIITQILCNHLLTK